MERLEYLGFLYKGFRYRTNGDVVEAKDGENWHATGSLPIVLHARKLWAQRDCGDHCSNHCPHCHGMAATIDGVFIA